MRPRKEEAPIDSRYLPERNAREGRSVCVVVYGSRFYPRALRVCAVCTAREASLLWTALNAAHKRGRPALGVEWGNWGMSRTRGERCRPRVGHGKNAEPSAAFPSRLRPHKWSAENVDRVNKHERYDSSRDSSRGRIHKYCSTNRVAVRKLNYRV